MARGMSRLTPVSARYTGTAIALHWLIALAIIGTFSLGLYMSGLPFSPDKLKLYSWHKWAGVTIFLLALTRLAWRATHQPPPLPWNMPAWQRLAAHGTHFLLYVLMLAIPLSGWLMSSAKGVQTVWFGVVPLPDLLPKNRALGDAMLTVHQTLNFTMAGLVIAHIGAALRHRFINRDDVFQRILPWRSR